MKKIIQKILLTVFFVIGILSTSYSQCNTAAYGLYPAATFTPANCGGAQTITAFAWASEYSNVNLTAGVAYTFYTSVATDVITITDNANVVVAFATGSVSYTAPTTGVYRFYRHLAGCAALNVSRVAYVSTPVPPTNDNCAGAIAILSGTTSGSINACANIDAVPLCGTATAPTTGGVWYSYTTSCSALVTASLCTGTVYNSQISVFDGSCGALNCIGGNDDFCGTQSEVSWSATAGTTYYILVHGNGAIGSFDLTLSQVDISAPVADLDPLPDVNSVCSVTLTAPTATDNCAGTIVATTTDPTTYSLNGSYTVNWVYNDGNGNTSVQTQDVVINDPTPPTIVCLNDTTVGNDEDICGRTFVYSVGADDNCYDNTMLTQNLSQTATSGIIISCNVAPNEWMRIFNLTGSLFLDSVSVGIGENITPQTININLYSLSGPLDYSNLTLLSSFPAFAPLVTAGSPIILTVPTSYTVPAGTNLVVGFSYGGGLYPAGNTAGQTDIAYLAAPSCGAPQPVDPFVAFGFTDQNILMNLYGSSPSVTISQTAGLPSGSLFPMGTTTNTFVATDGAGNTATCSFDVIVQDMQAPVPDVTQSFTFSNGAIDVDILDGTTAIDSVLVTGLPAALTTGMISSICININHTFDADLDISLISPLGTIFDLSSDNGGGGDNFINTCFDMTAASNITTGVAPFTGSYIPEGAGGFGVFNGEDPNGYWKISIFDDAGGDIGNLTEFTLNFENPEQLPTLNADCSIALTAPTGNDNCDGAVTATTSDPLTYTTDGVYTINWEYTDLAGNTFIQTQTVIVEDSIAPVADIGSLASISDTCSVLVSSVPTATDNCEGTITGTTTDPLTYNDAGTYTITWSYDDGRGNITTQTQTVTVIDVDPPVPSLVFLPNVVGNCVVSVPAPPTASDNCSGDLITGTTTDPISYNLPGTYFIIWHFDDGNGNTWTQNQTVVVQPCLGVEGESGEEITVLVYPNPGTGVFTLSLSEMPTEKTDIRLMDALGQIIYSGELQNQVQQFDFSHLAASTYYLLITNNHGHVSKPIIINH